ncbi:hypothetical protein [Rickettsiales endosymbiont of Stachyamoeba lipophora]|uniref:hypothetical protein n=1 Tax=Rickettsiales endosymbiont of Stachyamoeba lipophora TaxID=2486578 RepID=UPI000F647EDB|nr:hypothetical protein [Rickettsiales endosymbiont of Stachyamoeba lipophora]AZL15143.1 hypothetical protein EF513_01020 [Rickettsiales endosymbiont of Stachyamoeba lipophora]
MSGVSRSNVADFEQVGSIQNNEDRVFIYTLKGDNSGNKYIIKKLQTREELYHQLYYPRLKIKYNEEDVFFDYSGILGKSFKQLQEDFDNKHYPRYLESMRLGFKIEVFTARLYRNLFNLNGAENFLIPDLENDICVVSKLIPDCKNLEDYQGPGIVKGLGRDSIISLLFGESDANNRNFLVNNEGESIRIDLERCFQFRKSGVRKFYNSKDRIINKPNNLLSLLCYLVEGSYYNPFVNFNKIDLKEVVDTIHEIASSKEKIISEVVAMNDIMRAVSSKKIIQFKVMIEHICSISEEIEQDSHQIKPINIDELKLEQRKLYQFLVNINKQVQYFNPNWVDKSFNILMGYIYTNKKKEFKQFIKSIRSDFPPLIECGERSAREYFNNCMVLLDIESLLYFARNKIDGINPSGQFSVQAKSPKVYSFAATISNVATQSKSLLYNLAGNIKNDTCYHK